MIFPEYRPRRLRKNEVLRSLVRETTLSADHLIYPLFVQTGKNIKDEISSMPGVFRLSVDQLAAEAKLCGYTLAGQWLSIESKEDLKAARKVLDKKNK